MHSVSVYTYLQTHFSLQLCVNKFIFILLWICSSTADTVLINFSLCVFSVDGFSLVSLPLVSVCHSVIRCLFSRHTGKKLIKRPIINISFHEPVYTLWKRVIYLEVLESEIQFPFIREIRRNVKLNFWSFLSFVKMKRLLVIYSSLILFNSFHRLICPTKYNFWLLLRWS